MEGNLTSKEGNPIKSSHLSNNGQSPPVIKAIPQIGKLRTESLRMSPLSLNGSLTTVDVCDTSFGKKVFEDMKTNAELPDESFSEEVLQDMDYSLDALRDAVPVLCLKKNDDSCDDADIFEEMSAYQVMGIYNNKDSQRRDQVSNRENGNNDSELKNKRPYADKNIDVLYQNRENEDKDKLECTKPPGKKIDEGEDEVNKLMKDNEKDINNNNECPMETKTNPNGYDWIQNKDNINPSENFACNFNTYQGKGGLKGICQLRESFGCEEGNESLCENKNNINVDVKDKTDKPSKVSGKDHVLENEVSNSCKIADKEQCNEELSNNNNNQDSLLHNMAEKKAFKKEKDLNEHGDKYTENVGVTVGGELHDKSEISKLNDSMRNISEDNNCEMAIEANCGTAIDSDCVTVSFTGKCSSCDFMSPKKILLQQHHVFYHDKWLYQCSVCGSGYNTKGALEYHKLEHSGCKMRKRKFKCSLCSKTFFFRLSLQKHLKNHKYKVQNIKPLKQRRPKIKKSAFIL